MFRLLLFGFVAGVMVGILSVLTGLVGTASVKPMILPKEALILNGIVLASVLPMWLRSDNAERRSVVAFAISMVLGLNLPLAIEMIARLI